MIEIIFKFQLNFKQKHLIENFRLITKLEKKSIKKLFFTIKMLRLFRAPLSPYDSVKWQILKIQNALSGVRDCISNFQQTFLRTLSPYNKMLYENYPGYYTFTITNKYLQYKKHSSELKVIYKRIFNLFLLRMCVKSTKIL